MHSLPAIFVHSRKGRIEAARHCLKSIICAAYPAIIHCTALISKYKIRKSNKRSASYNGRPCGPIWIACVPRILETSPKYFGCLSARKSSRRSKETRIPAILTGVNDFNSGPGSWISPHEIANQIRHRENNIIHFCQRNTCILYRIRSLILTSDWPCHEFPVWLLIIALVFKS